jgi:hypothetical protein
MKNISVASKKVIVLSLVMIAVAAVNLFGLRTAQAQFSKPVVMFTGKITASETGKAYPVKVSIRNTENKDQEITSGRSNSESGKFLVVLQPNKKYWVRLESGDVVLKEELVETPAIEKTTQLTKDFALTTSKDVVEKKEKLSQRTAY